MVLRRYSVEGARVDELVGRSLMLVTALSPHIRYDRASAIAHKADNEGTTLREAALSMGVSAAEFDRSGPRTGPRPRWPGRGWRGRYASFG